LDAVIGYASTLPAADRELPQLECAMVTGEAASVTLVNRWFYVWPHVPLVNAYGPTEAADDICQHVIRGLMDQSNTGVPIGVPLDNLSVMVLDREGNITPAGVPGEICVSGVGVGAGYWQQPERTAAAFVPNRHHGIAYGDTIYRTGDIGRRRTEGTIEFLG